MRAYLCTSRWLRFGAVLGRTKCSRSTGAVLAVQLTHHIDAILSLQLASVIAHVFVAANIFQLLPPRRLLE